MRSVLIVLGIAVAAIFFSALLTPSKNLTHRPQDREWERKEAATKASNVGDSPKAASNSEEFNPPREGVMTTVLTVQGKGDITIELYPKAAPKTVAEFVRLIKSRYYDGIKFHRVEPDFVVQAGDPQSRTKPLDDPMMGSGGSGQTIPFETNQLGHVTGAVAMALKAARSDTGDGQFFINLKPNHFLDGNYCVFGKVTNGMDVVKKIAKGDTIAQFVVK